MFRKLRFLLIIAFLLLPLQGCWGMREIDEMGYVLLMGIDKGKENMVKVTFQIALPKPLGEEGSGDEVSTEIVEVEAASLFGAEQLLNTFVSKHITLIHNTTVVVSEEIAREGLAKYINPLVRSREIRRTNYLLVVKGKANDFIEKNRGLVFEKYPSRQIDILMASSHLTGIMYKSDIHMFYKALKSPGRQPVLAAVGISQNVEAKASDESKIEEIKRENAYLPGEIPRKGGNKIDVIGQAVFKEERLVDFLNGEETRFYQMVTGEFRQSIFSFPEPGSAGNFIIVMKIRKACSPDITITADERKTTIKVKLFLNGEIMSIQSGKNYEIGPLGNELERHISGLITAGVSQLIKKTQKEYYSDIFGFGEFTRHFFWTWEEWENYQWLEKYPYCAVEVQTFFRIRDPGMMSQTTSSDN